MSEKMVYVCFRMPKSEHDLLKEHAKFRGTDVSKLIRRWVRHYVIWKGKGA